MPSHNVHVKWCFKIIGKAFPEVDKFLDEFTKEIDIELLKQCLIKCREYVKNIPDIEPVSDFYVKEFGFEPMKYSFTYLLYTYVDIDEQLKFAFREIKRHDSWRIFDPCLTLMYVFNKFGIDGLKCAIVHIILDEIAQYVKCGFTTCRRIIESICSILQTLPNELIEYVQEICNSVRKHMKDLIIDVGFSLGVNLKNRKIDRIEVLTSKDFNIDSIINYLRKYNIRYEIFNLDDCSYDFCYKIFNELKNICKSLRISVSNFIKFNELIGLKLNQVLLLVKFSNNFLIPYPHSINCYGVGKIVIRVEDFLQDLPMLVKND